MAYVKDSIWVDFTPKSGDTITIPVTDAGTTVNICLNNAALIAALTLSFPITGVQDGQKVVIFAKNTVSTVTQNVESGGFFQGALSTLIGSGGGVYKFRKDALTWMKVPSI